MGRQANLVVLPREWAFDMLLFAQRNPQPVPLLDVTEPGAFTTALASDADLRTDLPRYRLWRHGACGVTPQAALMALAPPFAITHAPGYMHAPGGHVRDRRS